MTVPALDLLDRMCQIRQFEELVARAHADGRLPGLLHLSIGGEAVAVGVLGLLEEHDRVYSTHRGHGHFLAAGEDPLALMAELAGRETGLCRGRGGSMHLMGRRAVLATGVVGGSLPIALGHALALPDRAVSIAFFGDGAVQSGVFHETLNLASLWRAPMLFVCENNGWAEFTSREEHTAVETVAEYGHLHKMSTETVDGGDVLVVRDAAARLLDGVRGGGGPALLECQVTRIRPHYEGDLRRTGDDHNDPVERLARSLVEGGTASATIAEVQGQAAARADQALARALGDPLPHPDHDAALVFARQP
jgi:pyruvate dehydrogenase E1 component alpha subunit